MKSFSVSCLYLSEDQHREVVAHDSSIYLALKTFGVEPPFVLCLKDGVTKELYDYVAICMQSGISTADIEQLLMNLRNAHHLRQFNSFFHQPLTFKVTETFWAESHNSDFFVVLFWSVNKCIGSI